MSPEPVDGRAASRPPNPPVRVSVDGGVMVLTLTGSLDEDAGRALAQAAEAAVAKGATRLDIDLRQLVSFTDRGAAALVACRELAERLAEGLHYRSGKGAGRDALLAAYANGTAPG
jgi:ABC-type transporter Mla MlaB component